jgi:hypothetical protein
MSKGMGLLLEYNRSLLSLQSLRKWGQQREVETGTSNYLHGCPRSGHRCCCCMVGVSEEWQVVWHATYLAAPFVLF